VGKTYLLREWGGREFLRVHYVNFEKQPDLRSVFERDFDTARLLSELSFVLNTPIDRRQDLLFFDEIQSCPRAITALKYFCEDARELAIVCAGSLLGVALSPESFPVGKVDFLSLYPMSFVEFLGAFDRRHSLEHLPPASLSAHIPEIIHNHLWDMLRLYYVTGGMPEVVQLFIDESAPMGIADVAILEKVRRIQRSIVTSYESDIAKHAGKTNATHIHALYRNIPSQLQTVHDGSTRRFQFNEVMPGKKGFAAWERPMHWLINAGLIHQIKIANKAAFPLEHFTKPNLFKLFPHDIGLLGAMLDIPPSLLIQQKFGTAKGFFAEAYVAQQLIASAPPDKLEQLYSWHEGDAEIEFLLQQRDALVPIEVKSSHRTKARSLGEFIRRYEPPLAVKVSTNQFSYTPEKRIVHLPLSLIHWIRELE
jgi:predicted AAA+ superfamily ATPase